MRPITNDVLRQLKLADALVRVSQTERNLVPSQPGWDQLVKNNATIKRVVSYLENRFRRGIEVSTERELTARKPGHGVRPVAFWGIEEQVLYDALVEAAVHGLPSLDRSVSKYIEFVEAPVVYARQIEKDRQLSEFDQILFSIINSEIKYVVSSDLTSFYQYIDHAVLADELIAQGANYDIVSHLVDLLSEVTGRPSGLPQLYDASDRLSEVYVDQVERNLLRQGFAVWRFNDDFRIACRSFSESIAAIEALDSAARSVGLAINELKTFTFHFSTYVLNTYGIDSLPEGGTISMDDVEAIAGDYQDDFSEDSDSAAAVIRSANISGQARGIDLREIDRDGVRRIRRALSALANEGNTAALESAPLLMGFVPSLTPDLAKYLIAVGASGNAERAGEVIDLIVESVSLNTWQKVWLIECYRSLELFSSATSTNNEARSEWIQQCFYSGKEPLRAFAFRALAAASRVAVYEAVEEAASSPGAVKAIYLASVSDHLSSGATQQEEKAVAALRETNEITKAILVR
ncbi:hypothetical protein H0264_28830 [Nocardia huaxiensis]|uniref:Reverse transcriptase domain-containing protein n=1 Tax=Nocardia huaxiensis TaxID=2755382 RepID=A0A7D6VCT4_9NOCA|nr:reverse transcriptase domain-containing protein [Nocardia huaxiensis]QLY29255.1 hypothetical protein H0264_28830 [Nocardia huaxiensis]